MKMDSSNIEHYFKGIGCSFEQKQDELKISRFVNGGDFIRLGFYFIFVLFVLSSIFFGVLGEIFGGCWVIVLIMLFSIILPSSIRYLVHITFTVNSKGFFVKTINNKKYFIPREKIDCCISKKVKRYKYKNSDESESFYGVVIKLNEIPDKPIKLHEDALSSFNYMFSGEFFSNFDKVRITSLEVDTGLCYDTKKPAKYLANEFNKYLGIEVIEEEKVKSKDTVKKRKVKSKTAKVESV